MAEVTLTPVEQYENSEKVLWELLLERDGKANINVSNKVTPSFERHVEFVRSHPYHVWYIVSNGDEALGSVYLTKPPKHSSHGDEIGIFIFRQHHGKGYGKAAINKLMSLHPRDRYCANINPNNHISIKLFEGLGFNICQYTLEKVK